jgi:hypothetical protein
METCKTVNTPHQPGYYLSTSMSRSTDQERTDMKTVSYSKLVGSLNWLATSTRPDIANAVGTLCRFISNPGRQHSVAIVRNGMSATENYRAVQIRHCLHETNAVSMGLCQALDRNHSGENTCLHALHAYYFLGLKHSRIAPIFRKSPSTICRWIELFEKTGLACRKDAERNRNYGAEKRAWIRN